MLQALKRLFRFDYLSPHSLEVCEERLTPDYIEKLIEEKKYNKVSWIRWRVHILTKNKKAAIPIYSIWGQFTFVYKLTLEGVSNGTLLHCKHNPFGITALWLPALLALACLVGVASAALAPLYSEIPVDITKPMALLAFCAIFVATCVVIEYFARNAVNRLVEQLVDAKPVK